jgi:hypothetical protein
MRHLVVLALVVAFTTSATPAAAHDSLGAAARDFVRLQLAIGVKEDGYVDGYFGPDKLRAEGKAMA